MDESSLLGGLERFSRRNDVDKALVDIADLTAGLNESLTYSSDDYDSLVVFSHVPGEAAAIPLLATDAYNTSRDRHLFREANITGRRVVLKGTALGRALTRDDEAGYAPSAINHESPQMIYTERLVHNDTLVGAVQHSFTPPLDSEYIEHLPDQDEIESFADMHRHALTQVAARVALLQSLGKEHGPLGLSLEYDDPIAPNAFIVRWDIEGSTHLARGTQMRALDAYESQAHLYLRRLTEAYQKRYRVDQYGIDKIYDDQGDGAYLILPLPASHDPYDTQVLRDYHHYNATPFMQSVHDGLQAIGAQYFPDLQPKVQVSGDFGYFEENGIGRLKSSTMYSLSGQKKK